MTLVTAPPTPTVADLRKNTQLAPLIRLDLFPAAVSSPNRSILINHDKARVVVTTDALFVFIDSPQGPAVALKARLDTAHGDRTNGYTFTFTPPADKSTDPPTPRSLATVKVTPSGGCGCGSRLRSFTPFTPMRYTNPGPNLR
jgi:hypothetical protein